LTGFVRDEVVVEDVQFSVGEPLVPPRAPSLRRWLAR
jgi:hypothetical protein